MKVRDEVHWAQAQEEMRKSGEIGAAFHDFVEFWVDSAETLLAERPEDLNVTDALRVALPLAEENLGPVSNHYLGQMLIVIASNWIHGEQATLGLTSIELKIMTEPLKDKIASAQQQAQDLQDADTSQD